MTTPIWARSGLASTATVSASVLAAVAWAVLLVLGHGSADHAPSPHHHQMAGHAAPSLVGYTAGWTIMVVAMMLPAGVPFLRAVERVSSGGRHGYRPVALAAGGYLLPWLAVGPLLWPVAGQQVIDRQLLTGATLVLAGVYQISGVKSRCLTRCRSPFAILARTWSDSGRPIRSATRAGLLYGLNCVACCWALMTLTVTAALSSLAAMAVLTAVMLAERIVPRIRACMIGTFLVLTAGGVVTLAAAITT